MLTGDDPRAARASAAGVDVDKVPAELPSIDLLRAVGEPAAGRDIVAMFDSGREAAPSMAHVRLPFSKGAVGSGAALATA